MTVSSAISRSDYAGNGSTTAFATGFRFLQNSDLRVILTVDATGVETVQVETTNYTVSGAGLDAGGTVTMLVAPASGETLTIKRDVPLTQGTDYVENDAFPAESHEAALDKLTMIVQQQKEELNRTLRLSESQIGTGLTVPVPDTDKFLQWDSDGNLKNVDISLQGALAVSSFAQTYLDELTAAATRAVLETKESFTDLDETPTSFSGEANKRVKVNSGETAVEFVTDSFTELEDTPANLTGSAYKVAAVNASETALEFVTSLSTDNYAYFRDEKATGTAGGTSGTGSNTRTLNTTVVNNISGCSLSFSRVTLPAGTYYVRAVSPASKASRHRITFYNTSTSTTALIGSSQFADAGNFTVTSSTLNGVLNVTATHVFELRHYIQAGSATTGLGLATNDSLVEVYAELEIWRLT